MNKVLQYWPLSVSVLYFCKALLQEINLDSYGKIICETRISKYKSDYFFASKIKITNINDMY